MVIVVNLIVGIYSLMVMDVNGCIEEVSIIIVSEFFEIIIDFNVINLECIFDFIGVIIVVVNNGNFLFIYVWSNG